MMVTICGAAGSLSELTRKGFAGGAFFGGGAGVWASAQHEIATVKSAT